MAFTRIFALQSLLQKEGSVNARTKSGKTVLMIASEGGHVNIAAALIQQGADLNARDNGGHTALMWAARYGRNDAVKLLILAGADPEAVDRQGKTARDWAVEKNYVETARVIEQMRPKTALPSAASAPGGFLTAAAES